MRIAHTNEVRLFREVTGVEQALVQQIIGTAEEAYLADIRKRNMNYINYTVTGVLMQLQDSYGQLMPQELLEREEFCQEDDIQPSRPN